MGKTHQALKQAEKEYVNRQQQNILVSRQKFSRKWNFYGTLAVLLIAIGRISYNWGTRLQASLTANANDSVETAATQTAAPALPAASSAVNQPLQAKPRSLGRRFAWAASLMILGGLIFLCGLFWDNFRFNISGIDQIEPAGTTLEPPNREQSLSPSATNGNLQPIDRQELVSTQGTSLLESGGDVQLQTAESNHFSKQDSVPAKPQKKLGPTTVPLSELELPEIASESESQNNTLKVFESDNQTDELSAAKRATTQPFYEVCQVLFSFFLN